MPDRFFHDGAWAEVVQLDGTEAHHLRRVLRKQPGDLVELFNGGGEAARGVVVRIEKRLVELAIQHVFPPDPVLRPELVLAAAAPKGDRFRWLIEKATELGADRFIPLKTARSVVDPGGHKLEKLHQTVIAACKQSGRNRLMQIDRTTPLEPFAASIGEESRILLGSPTGEPLFRVLASGDSGSGAMPHRPEQGQRMETVRGECRRLVAIIGPEGGLNGDERQFLKRHGARDVSISPHTLRIETAAIALAGALAAFRMNE